MHAERIDVGKVVVEGQKGDKNDLYVGNEEDEGDAQYRTTDI